MDKQAKWENVTLSSLYSIKYGKANPNLPGQIPVIGSSGIYATTQKPLVHYPTIVIGRKGSAGQAWLVESPSFPSDTTFYLEPKKEASVTDIRFIYFTLKKFQLVASDDVIPSLQRHVLENMEIPLPSIFEQKTIATILSKIQSAIGAQEKTVAIFKELKSATMAKLFREGLRGEPLKQTEIGEVPESWEIKRLEQVTTIERGKFSHRPRNDPAYYGGTIPFVQTGDVTKSNGRIRIYSQTLNEKGLSVSRIFSKGTIVITIAANIGDTGILEFDSAFPDSIIGMTPFDNIVPEYLECYLRTQRDKMNWQAPKGTQKNINIEFLKPWPVPLPQKEEQQQISHILQVIDKKIEVQERKRMALQDLFKTMLHLLMTGQVRVNNLKLKEIEDLYNITNGYI